ncbi:nucleolar protein 9-like isoform X3 [Zonotrichia albicollis]|uniref:nucleolar protein 9-like isoform X3 n=1 Tax=Zonotrichia albicollis TaxID=44394 RepID=UPI003D810446
MVVHAEPPSEPDMSRQWRQSAPRLDPDTAEYFRRALETLEEGAERGGARPSSQGGGAKGKEGGAKSKGGVVTARGAELPPSFRPLLEELAQGLEQQIPALLSPACASLCLQGALRALHRSQSPSCARFCRALIGCLSQDSPAHDQSPLLTSLQDPDRSRLLEAAMTVLDPPGLRELFRGHLRGHLRGVASHRVANHGLQRLLDHAPEDVVSEVLSELGPALQEPLARGHPGVILALLGAALRHPRLQGEALRSLFQALRCWAPPHHPHCVTALAQLRPLEGGDSGEEAEPEGHWGALAMDKSGSRVLDTAWACSPLQQRVQMASELAPLLPRLLRDPLGRGVARRLSLELFLRLRPRWEGLQRGRGLQL